LLDGLVDVEDDVKEEVDQVEVLGAVQEAVDDSGCVAEGGEAGGHGVRAGVDHVVDCVGRGVRAWLKRLTLKMASVRIREKMTS
jgi:hypothetical protein